MSIFFRRGSKLSKRIDRIEGELSTISSRIRDLSRDVEKQGDAVVHRAGHRGRGPECSVPAKPACAASDLSSVQTPGTAGYQVEKRASTTRPGHMGGPAAEPRTPHARRSGIGRPVPNEDEQFANYFMSGGLKKEVVEPLRRERSVQRGRALFLLLCLAALVFALLFYRFWR